MDPRSDKHRWMSTSYAAKIGEKRSWEGTSAERVKNVKLSSGFDSRQIQISEVSRRYEEHYGGHLKTVERTEIRRVVYSGYDDKFPIPSKGCESRVDSLNFHSELPKINIGYFGYDDKFLVPLGSGNRLSEEKIQVLDDRNVPECPKPVVNYCGYNESFLVPSKNRDRLAIENFDRKDSQSSRKTTNVFQETRKDFPSNSCQRNNITSNVRNEFNRPNDFHDKYSKSRILDYQRNENNDKCTFNRSPPKLLNHNSNSYPTRNDDGGFLENNSSNFNTDRYGKSCDLGFRSESSDRNRSFRDNYLKNDSGGQYPSRSEVYLFTPRDDKGCYGDVRVDSRSQDPQRIESEDVLPWRTRSKVNDVVYGGRPLDSCRSNNFHKDNHREYGNGHFKPVSERYEARFSVNNSLIDRKSSYYSGVLGMSSKDEDIFGTRPAAKFLAARRNVAADGFAQGGCNDYYLRSEANANVGETSMASFHVGQVNDPGLNAQTDVTFQRHENFPPRSQLQNNIVIDNGESLTINDGPDSPSESWVKLYEAITLLHQSMGLFNQMEWVREKNDTKKSKKKARKCTMSLQNVIASAFGNEKKLAMLDKIQACVEPCGFLILFYMSFDNLQNSLHKTAAMFDLNLHISTTRKGDNWSSTVLLNEILIGEATHEKGDTSKTLAVINAMNKLAQHYYTVEMTRLINGRGKAVNAKGELVPVTSILMKAGRKSSNRFHNRGGRRRKIARADANQPLPTCSDWKTDNCNMDKVKSAIDQYKNDPYFIDDMVFLPEFSKKARKSILKYAEKKEGLIAGAYGGSWSRHAVVSKRDDIWAIVNYLISDLPHQVVKKCKYKLYSPGQLPPITHNF